MTASKSNKPLKMGLQGHIGVLLALLVIVTGMTLAFIGYFMVSRISENGIREKAEDLTEVIRTDVMRATRRNVQPMLNIMASGVLPELDDFEQRLARLPLIAAMLDNFEIISAFMLGYEDGDFFMARQFAANEERMAYNAPAGSVFMVFNVSRAHDPPTREILFYNHELEVLSRRVEPAGHFDDVRDQPWFNEGMRANDHIEFSPFFIAPNLPVMFFARKSENGRAVVAADITIRRISEILRRELPTPNSIVALVRPDGTLITCSHGFPEATSHGPHASGSAELEPVLRMAVKAYAAGSRKRVASMDDGREEWEVYLEEFHSKGAASELLLMAIPMGDLKAEGRQFLFYAVLGVSGLMLCCAPLIWMASRRISGSLRMLVARTGAMHEFLLDDHKSVHSGISEIQALDQGMNNLRGNIKRILTVTRDISRERDFGVLLPRVLRETVALAQACGGMLVILDENGRAVSGQGGVCWMKERGLMSRPIAEGDLLVEALSGAAISHRKTTRLCFKPGDLGYAAEFEAPDLNSPEVLGIDMVCVPLCDRRNERMGMLVLFKAVKADEGGFHSRETAFIEAFASAAAVAMENQRLLNSQSDMRDALMRILAGAIDAKSPYTGGHCQRVPVIFFMLLEAACAARDGPLKEFDLDENGWETAKMAAWLHDCGKVTTPEYVMDKATKLETIYDRIHEIRTRFEVLKRDAEIAFLQAVLGGADPKKSRQDLKKEQAALDDDFAFVASCNAGMERMGEKERERLAAIGRRAWLRTLDKRLGVSRAEAARMKDAAAPPALEGLLMDLPEHIIERGEKDRIPSADAAARGFRLKTPKVLYNRGEIYNLSIASGTLNEEERYKINDHIIRTIIMLESMPLPGYLRDMPEVAGSHHETMDGHGYPRGLVREEMSWQARMMAVADIFEALTAGDRPYKSGKSLREALEIMDGLCKSNKLDPDVYALFLDSGIPRRYASVYLTPEQNNL